MSRSLLVSSSEQPRAVHLKVQLSALKFSRTEPAKNWAAEIAIFALVGPTIRAHYLTAYPKPPSFACSSKCQAQRAYAHFFVPL